MKFLLATALVAASFSCCIPLALAQETEEKTEFVPLTEAQRERGLHFIKSLMPDKREGAFRAFRKRGAAGKEEYAEILEEAREALIDGLDARAVQITTGRNGLTDFATLYDQWKNLSEEAYGMVKISWKREEPNGYKKKFAEMDQLFKSAAATYEKLDRQAGRVGQRELSSFNAYPQILHQIDVELAWAQDEVADDAMDLMTALKAGLRGEDLADLVGKVEAFRAWQADAKAVDSHNSGSRWANAGQSGFAKLLNYRRTVLGLQALRLDENLSKACVGHSTEMVKLDYFDHTSPTKKNRSFGDRARNANFSGSPTGECIYVGSSSPASAHKGWWYSDGHRTIMYAKGPNTLGLGPVGDMWTLNTGKIR